MYQVVVKKWSDVGIMKVRFVGSYDDCVRWMCVRKWGYYDVIGPDGRLRSYVLRDLSA